MSNADSTLTASYIRDRIIYNQETGLLTWAKTGTGFASKGSPAGCKSWNGYLRLCLLGKQYMAHRIAWIHVHGEWPKNQIDHINGDKADNRIMNLRDVSQSINLQNRSTPKKINKSGFLGVTQRGKRWLAQIRVPGKNIRIGLFDTPELAHAAYLEEKQSRHQGVPNASLAELY